MVAGDEPIRTPEPVGPDYPWEPDYEAPLNPVASFGRKLADLARKPAHWIRENVVEPNRGPKYYWYHRKYERAIPIDECFVDDMACFYEANVEYKRNYLVDRQTLLLLQYRKDSCLIWNLNTRDNTEPSEKCKNIIETHNREETNFFIKYGELPVRHSVMDAYNKQKHRMIMERRRDLRNQKEEDS